MTVHDGVSTLVHGMAGEGRPGWPMPHKGRKKAQNGCNTGGVNRVA